LTAGAHLYETAFAVAFADGQRMTLDQAVDYALVDANPAEIE
jgi:hypothetical protein